MAGSQLGEVRDKMKTSRWEAAYSTVVCLEHPQVPYILNFKLAKNLPVP